MFGNDRALLWFQDEGIDGLDELTAATIVDSDFQFADGDAELGLEATDFIICKLILKVLVNCTMDRHEEHVHFGFVEVIPPTTQFKITKTAKLPDLLVPLGEELIALCVLVLNAALESLLEVAVDNGK